MAHSDSAALRLESETHHGSTTHDAGLSRATRVAHLLNRIDAHAVEGADTDNEQDALGLTNADIRKLQATRKTLAALMGGDILPSGVSL